MDIGDSDLIQCAVQFESNYEGICSNAEGKYDEKSINKARTSGEAENEVICESSGEAENEVTCESSGEAENEVTCESSDSNAPSTETCDSQTPETVTSENFN